MGYYIIYIQGGLRLDGYEFMIHPILNVGLALAWVGPLFAQLGLCVSTGS